VISQLNLYGPNPNITRYQLERFVRVMGQANVTYSSLRSVCFLMVSSLRAEITELRKGWGYNPGRHYMRGPGPKWREKHGIPS